MFKGIKESIRTFYSGYIMLVFYPDHYNLFAQKVVLAKSGLMLLIFIFSVYSSKCYAQESYILSSTMNQENRLFSLSVANRVYLKGDTILITLKVANNSNKRFFILDKNLIDLESLLTIDDKMNSVAIELYGPATFFPEHQYKHPKLLLLESNSKVSYNIKLDSNKVMMREMNEIWFFWMEFCYFTYDERLLYLTAELPEIPIKDPRILHENYKWVNLSQLPISITIEQPPR